MFLEIRMNIFYLCCCVCNLTQLIINVFHLYQSFFQKLNRHVSDKAVLVPLSIVLLVAACFCICPAHAENKVGHHSQVKSQSPCENEYKDYCLIGGEGSYLFDDDFIGCN